MAKDHKLTKSIGEHFVCSALAQAGWAASLTRDGIARTDILAVNSASGEMIQIQVKTSTTWKRPSWLFGEVKLPDQPGEWYVLVVVGEAITQRPRCFVVPRDHVAAGVWMSHQSWLNEPGVPPGKRNTPMKQARTGEEMFRGYEERWDLLDLPTAPILLDAKWQKEMATKDVGLPRGHPWLQSTPRWPGPENVAS